MPSAALHRNRYPSIVIGQFGNVDVDVDVGGDGAGCEVGADPQPASSTATATIAPARPCSPAPSRFGPPRLPFGVVEPPPDGRPNHIHRNAAGNRWLARPTLLDYRRIPDHTGAHPHVR